MSILLRNDLFLRKIFSVALPGAVAAGEPTYTWYFNLPTGYVIDKIEASAAVADGTDGFVATLQDGSTVLYTAAVIANATPVEDTGVATGEAQTIPSGTTLNVVMDFSGATTSENVDNPYIVVYGHVKPRQ